MYFLLLFKSKYLQPLVHYQTPCIIMLARNLILLLTPANSHRPAAPILQISHICANCTLYNTALSNCTNKGKLLSKLKFLLDLSHGDVLLYNYFKPFQLGVLDFLAMVPNSGTAEKISKEIWQYFHLRKKLILMQKHIDP